MALVQVSFSVFVGAGSPLAPGEAVYVCGNVAELGGWRPEVRSVLLFGCEWCFFWLAKDAKGVRV